MKTDILISHCGGLEILENCLASLKKNTDLKSTKIYVLFNAVDKKEEWAIKNKFPFIFSFFSHKNLGFAEAVNFLVKKSESEYLVFLNNDVEVGKNWLSELHATMKRNKNCIACQSKIRSYNDKRKFEYAGAAGGFIDIYGYPFCRGRIFNEVEEDFGQYDDERKIFWGCGVCLLIKRENFLELGMFDEDLFMYAKELDFCWRANIFGKEIFYSPKSIVYHIGSYTINKQKINRKKDFLLTRSHLIVILKNYSLSRLIFIFPQRVFLEIISALRFFPTRTYSLIKTMLTLPYYYITKIHKKRMSIQNTRTITGDDLDNLIYSRSLALAHFLEHKNKFSDLRL